MSDLNGFVTFLHEKSKEDIEVKALCEAITKKYLENKKLDLHDQYAREENILVKLGVTNLESILNAKTSNDDALDEFESLLMEFDKEHFKAALDLDYVIDKLNTYEKIKAEMETRNASNAYEQLYLRKLNMVKRLEGRHVVKKYRQKERERINTKNERLRLEERVKQKTEEIKAKTQEINCVIVRLVQGSKKIEALLNSELPTRREGKPSERQTLAGMDHHLKANTTKENLQPKGLSSRLHLVFNEFKVPSTTDVPKNKPSNQARGRTLLFRQADSLRQSIQKSINTIPDRAEHPQKLQGILKIPTQAAKPGNQEVGDKLPDDVGRRKGLKRKTKDQEAPSSSSKRKYVEPDENSSSSVDTSMGFACPPSTRNPSKVETKKQKIETKCPKKDSLPQDDGCKVGNRRKGDDEEVARSSLKRSRETPTQDESKGFMEIFLEFSKDTSMAASSPPGSDNKSNDDLGRPAPKKSKIEILENVLIKPAGSNPPFQAPGAGKEKTNSTHTSEGEPLKGSREHSQLESKSFMDIFAGSMPPSGRDTNTTPNDVKNEAKRGKTVSFDDFDDFFMGFANTGADGSDNSDNLAEVSFNFMEGNENAADPDDDQSSFQF